MDTKSKKAMTDIAILNRALYGSIVHIKDIVIQAQLTLAVMDALNRLEDEALQRP
jgi:hypothetical protein